MLEDIALMRVLPNMRVVVPADSIEAAKATLALAGTHGPAYIRLAREKTPIVTTEQTPFSLAKAQVFREGKDVTILACGPMVYQALVAAESLGQDGISAEVINVAIIKPLDTATILTSLRKTNLAVTVEEAQYVGGLGGAIAEIASENHPIRVARIGMVDRFGESGDPGQLVEHFGLTAPHIAKRVKALIKEKS